MPSFAVRHATSPRRARPRLRDIQTYVQNLGFPGSGNMVGQPLHGPPTPREAPVRHAGCNSPGDQVTVTVTYQFPVVIPFVPRRTLSMSSTAAMVISQ